MKNFLKITIVTFAFLSVSFLPKIYACESEVCCNESCNQTASCSGTLSCHADGNNGTVTCDGARSSCGPASIE